MWARIHLIPALQAEEDRDQVRRYLADKAREKELLGTETRVYNSDRYVLTHIGIEQFANYAAGSCDPPSPSLPRTRQSKGYSVEIEGVWRYVCTYKSERVMEVGMVPFMAVPHRKMHNSRIYDFFGLTRHTRCLTAFCDDTHIKDLRSLACSPAHDMQHHITDLRCDARHPLIPRLESTHPKARTSFN